ncbi:MFS transporter [Chloroflexota bacterium]
MPESDRNSFFYGYIIVIAGVIILSVMWSVHFSYGVFFKELASEFNLSRAVTSGAWSIPNLIYGISSVLMGKMTDKLGPRAIVIVCGLLMGLGYFLMSRINAAWQLYLLMSVLGGVGMGAAFVPVLSTVARWFVRHRGFVTGIVASGISIGGLVGPLVASWLIAGYGWRVAYVVFGVVVFVVNLALGQFLRRDPEAMGQVALRKMPDEGLGTFGEGLTLREVTHFRQFWLLLVAWFCYGVFAITIVVHLIPHITDKGISATAAATILATLGGVGIFSRVFMGVVSDRIGSINSLIVSLFLMFLGLVLLLFARDVWLFYLLVLAFGFGFAACGALISLVIADLFGRKAHGVILGSTAAAWGLGSSTGPILLGYIYDLRGSYQVGFLISVALSVVAITIFIYIRQVQNQITFPGGNFR